MKIHIPYCSQLILPILGWAIVCFIFNIIIILNIIGFSPESQDIFLIISVAYFLVCISIALLRIIPIYPFSLSETKSLDKNIKNGKLVSNISTDEVSKTFSILTDCSKTYLRNSLFMGLGYLILMMIWQLMFFNNYLDLLIIALIEVVIISLLIGFSIFWPQLRSFELIKECRDTLLLKGLCPIESYVSSIKAKFFFLLLFFVDVLVLYVLSMLCASGGDMIFISGLVMIIFISAILFFYLNKSFESFFNSAKMFSQEDLAVFSTGSLDKEFVDLSKNLNEISIKLYSSKQEAVLSKKEMENRVAELERFFDLTVSREEKMIELKKENAALRKKLEKTSK
jgi:hypothetical protein